MHSVDDSRSTSDALFGAKKQECLMAYKTENELNDAPELTPLTKLETFPKLVETLWRNLDHNMTHKKAHTLVGLGQCEM